MTPHIDPESAKRLRQETFNWATSMRLAAIPLIFGIPDLARVYARLPFSMSLYGTETILMALNGLGAIVAFGAVVTKRKWEFVAWCIWLLLGTIRLITVGNLK